MSNTLIELPALTFTLRIPSPKVGEVYVSSEDSEEELVASFNLKSTSMDYIEKQIHLRAKAMRRIPGEYEFVVEKGAKPIKARVPTGATAATAKEEDLAEAK